MAQIEKMEVQVEIKSSADRFYQMFRRKQHRFKEICPNVIKDAKVIEGDWESVGSKKEWLMYVEGGVESCKETVEAIDEKNKAITFNFLDGVFMKDYKTIQNTLQVTQKGDTKGSLAKWNVEYEKRYDDAPPPTRYRQMLTLLAKSVDEYLTNKTTASE